MSCVRAISAAVSAGALVVIVVLVVVLLLPGRQRQRGLSGDPTADVTRIFTVLFAGTPRISQQFLKWLPRRQKMQTWLFMRLLFEFFRALDYTIPYLQHNNPCLPEMCRFLATQRWNSIKHALSCCYG